jgi:hypothetical protein
MILEVVLAEALGFSLGGCLGSNRIVGGSHRERP